jgi:hypothetical protein
MELFCIYRPIPQDKRNAILNALNADKGFTQTMADTYFGGKQLGAMARLVLIAEELGRLLFFICILLVAFIT